MNDRTLNRRNSIGASIAAGAMGTSLTTAASASEGNGVESISILRKIPVRHTVDVMVAGRCIRTDRYMQGSIRVMPGCFIIGQAAGIAAAMTVEKKTDTRSVDVKELQKRLKAIGAFLPNC